MFQDTKDIVFTNKDHFQQRPRQNEATLTNISAEQNSARKPIHMFLEVIRSVKYHNNNNALHDKDGLLGIRRA